MPDELVRTLVIGLVATLLAFELGVSLLSWLEALERTGPHRASSLLLTNPVGIRDHFRARRHLDDVMRWQFPSLRTNRHGLELRMAIRRLRPAPLRPPETGWPSG